MENGQGLDLGLLPDLAESLDCTVTYLIGLSADPHSWEPDRRDRRPVSRHRAGMVRSTADGGEQG